MFGLREPLNQIESLNEVSCKVLMSICEAEFAIAACKTNKRFSFSVYLCFVKVLSKNILFHMIA